MLAHLEDFYLSPLLEHFNMSHVLFLDLLYGNFLGCLLVKGKFYEAELPLTQRLI